jgi:sensor histidine kinase YesM
MSSLQQRIAAFTDMTANLITQLQELDLLREQVSKAEEYYPRAEQEFCETRIARHDEHPVCRGHRAGP